jgi:sugar lactone lactonase YvrE
MIRTLSEVSCMLGEGAFWHPERQAFFWVDILGRRLYEHDGVSVHTRRFDQCPSAMGWVDRDTLLVATARELVTLDLRSGRQTRLAALEADNPGTRSNDGRADPQGGFWIGTMGLDCQQGAGAIYRYYRGDLRLLYDRVTIPNAICFTPDGETACFTDTPTRVVSRLRLDAEGWPAGDPVPWLDLRDGGWNPDGAVIDAEGNFWNAQWGASRVACYDPRGRFLHAVDVPATQVSCPAFGGPDLTDLHVTTAAADAPTSDRFAGMTFRIATGSHGQAEHRVIP